MSQSVTVFQLPAVVKQSLRLRLYSGDLLDEGPQLSHSVSLEVNDNSVGAVLGVLDVDLILGLPSLGVVPQSQGLSRFQPLLIRYASTAVTCSSRGCSRDIIVSVRRMDETFYNGQFVHVTGSPLPTTLGAGAVTGVAQGLETRLAEAVAAGQFQRPLGILVEVLVADGADREPSRTRTPVLLGSRTPSARG